MVIAAFAALALALECEPPPWMRDTLVAIRDSSDFVAEGRIVGIEEGPNGGFRATFEVERSWKKVVTPRLHFDFYQECGAELALGASYVVGFSEWEGHLLTDAAMYSFDAQPLRAQLGEALEPRSGSSAVFALVILAILLPAAIAGMTVYRREAKRSG